MGKRKSNKKGIFKKIVAGFVAFISGLAVVGCGATSGLGNIGSNIEEPKFENPYEGEMEKMVDDYNDVFLGAIGVYDIDNNREIFYDKYTKNFVSFNSLIDRQFNTLGKILYEGLTNIYGNVNGFDAGKIIDISSCGYSSDITFDMSMFQVESDVHYDKTNYVTNALYNFKDAIHGGYKLVGKDFTNPDETTTRIYDYDESQRADHTWNMSDFNEHDLINALKWIYLNTYKTYGTNLWSEGFTNNFNFLVPKLKNTDLKGVYNKTLIIPTVDNSEISSIGFTEDYAWNVLYYLAYSVIGETNVERQSQTDGVNADNYLLYEAYKGYDNVLPKIVYYAFNYGKEKNFFCVTEHNKDSAMNNTLNGNFKSTIFPMLERNEYIFFDDLNDICDAEEVNNEFNEDDMIDPKDAIDLDNKKIMEELNKKTIKVGSLRKLKKIILIPNIKEGYKLDEFSINDISICFSLPTGVSQVEVEVYSNLLDKEGNVTKDQKTKFNDGSFSFEVDDAGSDTGKSKIESEGKSENISSDGKLIVDDFPGLNKNGAQFSIFEKTEDSEKVKYTSVDDIMIFSESFTQISYDVPSTGEKIECARLNVYNNLFNITCDENGKYVYTINTSKNLIELYFKYYAYGGDELESIPNTYLLDFGIM